MTDEQLQKANELKETIKKLNEKLDFLTRDGLHLKLQDRHRIAELITEKDIDLTDVFHRIKEKLKYKINLLKLEYESL